MAAKKISQQTAIFILYYGLFGKVKRYANTSVINTVSGDFIPVSNLEP
jgi:hypothetical protein